MGKLRGALGDVVQPEEDIESTPWAVIAVYVVASAAAGLLGSFADEKALTGHARVAVGLGLLIGTLLGAFWQSWYRRDLANRLFVPAVLQAVIGVIAMTPAGTVSDVVAWTSLDIGIVMGLVFAERRLRARDAKIVDGPAVSMTPVRGLPPTT